MLSGSHQLHVHGLTGTLLLGGFSTAAVLGAWSIRNGHGAWHLSAALVRVDRFLVRQAGLGFTAPKPKGFWWWPVVSVTVDDANGRIVATLKPPEQ